MKDVSIYEMKTGVKSEDGEGKIAILKANPTVESPKKLLDCAIGEYVGNKSYNDFVEIYLDNPWIRVIVGGINYLTFDEFKDQKL